MSKGKFASSCLRGESKTVFISANQWLMLNGEIDAEFECYFEKTKPICGCGRPNDRKRFIEKGL
jgi:hypothetical protein